MPPWTPPQGYWIFRESNRFFSQTRWDLYAKLPHHLIEAFKSTLEEAKYADIILHVVDASNPRKEDDMHVVYDTLRQLGVENKKMITLFNKQDICLDKEQLRDFQGIITD